MNKKREKGENGSGNESYRSFYHKGISRIIIISRLI